MQDNLISYCYMKRERKGVKIEEKIIINSLLHGEKFTVSIVGNCKFIFMKHLYQLT